MREQETRYTVRGQQHSNRLLISSLKTASVSAGSMEDGGCIVTAPLVPAMQKYVQSLADGMQSTHGVDGHFNACWTHGMSREDARAIVSGGFLVSVIHGQSDIIANIRAAQRVARKLKPKSRMVEMRGAHLITMEKPKEVRIAR